MLTACMALGAQEHLTLAMPDGQPLHIIYYGDNIVRLFHDPAGGDVRDPEAKPQASILAKNPMRPLQSVRISVSVKEDGTISVYDGSRRVFTQDTPVSFQDGKTTLILNDGGGRRYYGGGVQNGRFAHAGKTIAIENQNSWTDGGVSSPAPWFWSTGGYGILWNTFSKGSYSFRDRVELTHETPYLDIFVFVDTEPADLLRDYYQLTGSPVLLPKFGFYEGHLNAYNRDYWTEAEKGVLFEDGKRYKESRTDTSGIRESLNGELPGNYQAADMPLGWILPNDGYGAGYGQTETLDGNILNLKEFGDYARSKGVEIGLWTQSDLHPVDTLPALLQRDIDKEVGVAGVRVLKTDVAWVGWGYSFGLNGIADAAAVMSSRGMRPFIITLDGWAGTQRYGGVWTGDQMGGQWEYIRFHIPTYIGAGLSGQPNIGSDMDGIFGGGNLWVNVRDFQWKAFTPMQLNMDGWGWNEKYPQALGERAAGINRQYLKLKSELMPYTYSIAYEAVRGLPMVRAVSLEYPGAPDRLTRYEYLYGPWFLVAPVYQETRVDAAGNDQRDGIYLPEGLWVDWFTGLEYVGGQVLNSFAAPLDKLPLFVKRGAIVPMTTPHNNPSELDRTVRIYEIYPYGSTSFAEHDDDGRTEAYLTGGRSRTVISQTLKGDKVTVVVEPTAGGFEGMVLQKETVLRIHTAAAPKSVTATVGKKTVEPEVTYAGGVARVVLPKASVGLRVEVKLSGFAAPSPAIDVPGVIRRESTEPRLSTTADAIVLKWDTSEFRELEFEGVTYTNIRSAEYRLEGLEPGTDYTLRCHDMAGEWRTLQARTLDDPMLNVIKGITATCTAPAHHGQGIEHMFNLEETPEIWHTEWYETAVPFEVNADLGAVYTLDRLEYVPRTDGSNGTILRGRLYTSVDGGTWSDAIPIAWERGQDVKTLPLGGVNARYVRLGVDIAEGGYGSGKEFYFFKVPGTDSFVHGVFNEKGEAVESL